VTHDSGKADNTDLEMQSAIFALTGRVTRRLEKKLPNYSISRPKSLQVKKGPNIYNKAQFESPKHLHQSTFETLKCLQQTMF
jgi:hypothetical protein